MCNGRKITGAARSRDEVRSAARDAASILWGSKDGGISQTVPGLWAGYFFNSSPNIRAMRLTDPAWRPSSAAILECQILAGRA
ncbi:hypothetical protein XI05_29480 [Bradyrhizobium sp. CCBAU 11357]|nr:hypothetical protein [Bradyrhizobium sp. CCBAU 11357]